MPDSNRTSPEGGNPKPEGAPRSPSIDTTNPHFGNVVSLEQNTNTDQPSYTGNAPVSEEVPLPNDDFPTVISSKQRLKGPVEAILKGDIRGCRLAHFELIEPIGVGGMAAVLRARDTQLDRQVALKILPPETAEDGENIRRFQQEARNAARLDHENIARVFFCGEDRQLHFIAFEFVEGENLRAIVDRRGRLPVTEALHYLLQVTVGLSHAASRGVVHRDIKPSNIIITPDGRAKLVDMGLARCRETLEEGSLTRSGVTLGTFDYISPEQALEPREADVRSDIYSLGCTFYHVLTGHPPVPEGTAAKKLHHHQHVLPIDPRQLAPDLPDEVAFILGRMLAKQPEARYQTPEALIIDLVQISGKLGVSSEVCEGIVQMTGEPENYPSSSPVNRPVLLGLLAIAAVVLLIFLVGPSPQSNVPLREEGKSLVQNPSQHPSPAGQSTKPPRKDSPQERITPPPKGHPPRSFVWEAGAKTTYDDLANWAERHQGADLLEIRLPPYMDISSRGDRAGQGLVLRANKVIIKPQDPKRRSTLRFRYDGKPQGAMGYDRTTAEKSSRASGMQPPRMRAALTIISQETTLVGVRLVVDALMSETTMVGVLIQGGTLHQVKRCEFIQAQPLLDTRTTVRDTMMPAHSLTSLLVNGQGRKPAQVLVEECCFLGFEVLKTKTRLAAGPDTVDRSTYSKGPASIMELTGVDPGGQDAIVRKGLVQFKAINCAFGPHQCVFRTLAGTTRSGSTATSLGAESKLSVQHCSLLLARDSTVFDLSAGISTVIEVKWSIFSRPYPLTRAEVASSAALIRLGERTGTLTYTGSANRYHQLDAFLVKGKEKIREWKDFRDWLEDNRGEDTSRILLVNPWDEAAGSPEQLLQQQRFVRAFRVNATLAELRHPNYFDDRLLGAEKLLGQQVSATPLPVLDSNDLETVARRELVVDPEVNDSGHLVYPKLEQAVLGAKPGDFISLRTNKVLKISPISLSGKGLRDLKIRAYPNYTPILTLGETTDPEPALFQLHDGKLRLEGITFRLHPEPADPRAFKMQVVVALMGDGQCDFRNCKVAMNRGGRENLALALASLPRTGKVMKSAMTPVRTEDEGPQLTLNRCLIRGQGDLLRVQDSRPYSVDIEDSLVALQGTLLHVQPRESAPATRAGHKASVRLQRVTTYLAHHLIRLDSTDNAKGLVPLHFAPDQCLFTPPETSRALLSLERVDVDRKTLKDKVLKWEAGQNVYGNFNSLIDHQPGGAGMQLWMTTEKWKMFTGESMSQFDTKLTVTPSGTDPFSHFLPKHIKLPKELKDYGVNAARLPEQAEKE